MRPAALLYAAALAGAGAGWFLAVLPADREARGLAADLEAADIAGARRRAAAWPGPTEEEERRLEESLAAFARPVPTVVLPAGVESDGRGGFAGTIPWTEVQTILLWASDQPRAVLSLEVQALPGRPDLASCRITLSPAVAR